MWTLGVTSSQHGCAREVNPNNFRELMAPRHSKQCSFRIINSQYCFRFIRHLHYSQLFINFSDILPFWDTLDPREDAIKPNEQAMGVN